MHKLETFSSNRGKLHVEVVVHFVRYIRDNKTVGLKYYSDMHDAPVSDILIKASIKTENQFMGFSDSSWQYFPDTVRSKGACVIFYKGVTIDHGTHVPVPVSQSSA